MNDLFHGFRFICAYIDDLLLLTKVYWVDHIHKLDLTLNKLKEKGIKYGIEKSILGQTKMEYLGFWVTCDDIKPINKNIEATTPKKLPTSQKEE